MLHPISPGELEVNRPVGLQDLTPSWCGAERRRLQAVVGRHLSDSRQMAAFVVLSQQDENPDRPIEQAVLPVAPIV